MSHGEAIFLFHHRSVSTDAPSAAFESLWSKSRLFSGKDLRLWDTGVEKSLQQYTYLKFETGICVQASSNSSYLIFAMPISRKSEVCG